MILTLDRPGDEGGGVLDLDAAMRHYLDHKDDDGRNAGRGTGPRGWEKRE